jgi:hypothetical protein
VEGPPGARKVVATLTNPFPDYVFQPGFTLPPLRNVEDYIRMHGRSSGLPSADSVAINGLDLGNVQTKTVEKIEELTLYIKTEYADRQSAAGHPDTGRKDQPSGKIDAAIESQLKQDSYFRPYS